jgi:hypothetical protein
MYIVVCLSKKMFSFLCANFDILKQEIINSAVKLSAQKIRNNDLIGQEKNVKGLNDCFVLDKVFIEWIKQILLRGFENEGERIIKYQLGR